MLANSHLKKGLFFFWPYGTALHFWLTFFFFFPEDHNIFIQHCGFFCTLECVFMRKITAQILITLHDFTIIAAIQDIPSHNAALICQCRSLPPWQSLLNVPVRVFWRGHGPGQGAEAAPRGLGLWALWEGELNEKQLIELGAKFPIWLQFWDQTVLHCVHQATHMAGLRYGLLWGLQKCCHPAKSFMKLTVVFSSVSLRHNTGFCKEAWGFHHGGHWGSPQKAPGKEKGKQGLVRSRRGQCLGHPWHKGTGPKLFTS